MSQAESTTVDSAFPFAAHFVSVENPGAAAPDAAMRLHYVDEGPSTGRPLVFLHGNPTWSYLYRRIIPPCVGAGYRALALDNMGFGLSDKPPDVAAHTARRHADHVRAFVDGLALAQPVIVGHAWGAFFALDYAAAHPDNVSALILLNGDTFAQVQVPLVFRIAIAPGLGDLIGRRWNLLLTLLLNFGTARREKLTAGVMAQYRRPFPTYASRAAVLGLPRMIPDGPGHPTYPLAQSLEAQLPRLSMPVLLVAGSADRLIGVPATRRLQGRLPNAESQILEGAGHYLQEDAPEVVTEAMLSFLRKRGL